MTDLAERLRRLRTVAGIGSRELDRLAGITESHSGLIEAGRRDNPTLATLDALATALGCSVGWLSKGEGAEPTQEQVAAAITSARGRLAAHAPDSTPAE